MTEPEAFDIDIAVSAELDGELAAYAAELGTDEAAVRAQIDAAPGASDRRTQLDAARRTVAAGGVPLDEITRARLVAGALAVADSPASSRAARRDRRPNGWYLRAGAAAAIALVVVGGTITLIAQDDGGGGAAKSAATGGTSVRSGNIGDIGDIDQKKLDELIGGAAPEAASSSTVDAQRSDKGSARSSSGQAVDGFDPSATARATPEQVAACVEQLGAQGTVRFNGSGAYQGEPAVIVGVAAGERTVVFVVAASDCSRVLYSVSR